MEKGYSILKTKSTIFSAGVRPRAQERGSLEVFVTRSWNILIAVACWGYDKRDSSHTLDLQPGTRDRSLLLASFNPAHSPRRHRPNLVQTLGVPSRFIRSIHLADPDIARCGCVVEYR
jgi:hypothetical protein